MGYHALFGALATNACDYLYVLVHQVVRDYVYMTIWLEGLDGLPFPTASLFIELCENGLGSRLFWDLQLIMRVVVQIRNAATNDIVVHTYIIMYIATSQKSDKINCLRKQ